MFTYVCDEYLGWYLCDSQTEIRLHVLYCLIVSSTIITPMLRLKKKPQPKQSEHSNSEPHEALQTGSLDSTDTVAPHKDNKFRV